MKISFKTFVTILFFAILLSGVVACDPSVPATPSKMILVDGGTFTREDSKDVTVSSFEMANYEVTQGQWETVMGSLPSRLLSSIGSDFGDSGLGDTHPVYNMSWYGAVEFCNKLSELEDFEPCYTLAKGTPASTDQGQ